jgi:cation:H+ antiporter
MNPLEVSAAGVAVVVGFVIAVIASRRAVTHTTELAAGTRIPRFAIGFTLLAIGTDLPEIANSIVSSLSGHGDLNVGDSVGSTATQVTLILGLLPLLGGVIFSISRRRFGRAGAATVGALLLGMALMSDGDISRLDATVLLGAWVLGSFLTWSPAPPGTQLDLPLESPKKLRKAFVVLFALAVVAAGAMLAVWGMTVIAEAISVPEYIVAFFLAAIGTSLPELVVDLTAIRQGQKDLAIGDAIGSSFVDSTLSIGIGPLIAPVAVTTSLALRGSAIAAIAVAIVVTILVVRRRHDRLTGVVLLLIYLGLYLFFITT